MAFTQQPLKPEEYAMRIIEDLGQCFSGKRKYRYAIFECTKCLKHFKARATGEAAKKQLVCHDCTLNPKETTKHPLYAIWNGIKQRCYSPKRKDYHKYGGKGVKMCDEWKNDAQAFIDWCLDNGWHKSLVVDKDIKCRELSITPAIYSPETISFITVQQNAHEANAKEVLQLDKDTNQVISTYESCVSAAISLGKPKTAKSSIANCARGITKTSFGYKWKYK
jgi:hypothetical protein